MTMLTEDEAKTKWCPLSRTGDTRSDERCTVNRAGNGPDVDCYCIASACMAWRSEPLTYEHGEALPFGTTPADPGWEKDGETWYCGSGVTGEKRQRWRKPNPLLGYCGAFGKPS